MIFDGELYGLHEWSWRDAGLAMVGELKGFVKVGSEARVHWHLCLVECGAGCDMLCLSMEPLVREGSLFGMVVIV